MEGKCDVVQKKHRVVGDQQEKNKKSSLFISTSADRSALWRNKVGIRVLRRKKEQKEDQRRALPAGAPSNRPGEEEVEAWGIGEKSQAEDRERSSFGVSCIENKKGE